MRESIKKRIEAVRHGEVPEGYKRTDSGVIPEEWPNSTIGKIIAFHSEKSTINNEYPVLTSARSGLVLQTEYFEDQVTREENAGYNVIPYGYVTYRSRSDDGRFTFNQNQIIEKGIVSCFYPVFRIIEDLADPTFVLSYLNNYLGRQIVKEIVGTSQLVLSEKKLSELRLPCPPLAEQQKIAKILATCDRVIELKERLLEEKQRQKRACLQKMLPQNGCDVPEWRLPGFSLPWQKKKLGELVTFYNGLTYSPDDIRTEGTLVLRSSNVKDGEIVDADNVYVDPTAVNSENVQIGDIIVVVRNGSRALIGKHAEIKADMPNTVIGAFMTGIRSEYPLFVNVLLSTPQFDKEVEKNLGAAINQITGYMFAKMEFMVPEAAERVAVGEFFRTIDDLIALYQQELEQEKQKKKALMQLLLTGLVRV